MAIAKSRNGAMSLTKALGVSLIFLPLLYTLFILNRDQPSDPTPGFGGARVLDVSPRIVNDLNLGMKTVIFKLMFASFFSFFYYRFFILDFFLQYYKILC